MKCPKLKPSACFEVWRAIKQPPAPIVLAPFTADWEEGFAALKLYQEREGHCRVRVAHKEGDHRLGGWVSRQRNKTTLAPERLQRLDEIGFVWDARKPVSN